MVENAYRAANVERKKKVVGALAPHYKALSKSHFGALVCKRCRVDQFVTAASEWEAAEASCVRRASESGRGGTRASPHLASPFHALVLARTFPPSRT